MPGGRVHATRGKVASPNFSLEDGYGRWMVCYLAVAAPQRHKSASTNYGSGSIVLVREPALARTYSSNAWCASTPITAPPSLRRPTREPFRSTSAMDSESRTCRKPQRVRP
jgi:hypothetical protein